MMSVLETNLFLIHTFGGGDDEEYRFAVDLPPMWDDEEFWELCQRNPQLRIERDAKGMILFMSPSGSATARRNAEVLVALEIWNRSQGKPGYVFDASAGFKLPNGATRAPDAAWVRKDRFDALSVDAQEKFAPLCPDFVVEVLSPSDSLEATKDKMDEYVTNGAILGFLIAPKTKQVFVYRPNQPAQTLSNPARVLGDPELPGFTMPLADIF